MDKERLIVLETVKQPFGCLDALLLDPGDAVCPYVVAHGYDPGTRSWSSGSYFADPARAACKLLGYPDPAWSVPGCTPDDVRRELGWGRLDHDEACEIAAAANARITEAERLPQDFSDEIRSAAAGLEGRRERWETALDGLEAACKDTVDPGCRAPARRSVDTR